MMCEGNIFYDVIRVMLVPWTNIFPSEYFPLYNYDSVLDLSISYLINTYLLYWQNIHSNLKITNFKNQSF